MRDEFQVFPRDGEKRWLDAWNRDQDLRSSMRNSVVWVYEGFARAIGAEREAEFLQRLRYGNMDISGGLATFWLDESLKISAHEQVAFLRGLSRNELPFPPSPLTPSSVDSATHWVTISFARRPS